MVKVTNVFIILRAFCNSPPAPLSKWYNAIHCAHQRSIYSKLYANGFVSIPNRFPFYDLYPRGPNLMAEKIAII